MVNVVRIIIYNFLVCLLLSVIGRDKTCLYAILKIHNKCHFMYMILQGSTIDTFIIS